MIFMILKDIKTYDIYFDKLLLNHCYKIYKLTGKRLPIIILFVRDRDKVKKLFSRKKIIKLHPHRIKKI